MPVGPEEEIVRAICTDKWDGERISPSLFDKRGNTSVSRLAVIPLEEHWDLFRRHVQKPPERLLEMIGQIKVGRLQQLGRDYKPRADLTVESDPVHWNAAHALIPQKITRGLATRLISALMLHREPNRR